MVSQEELRLMLENVCDVSFRGGNVQLGQVMNFGDVGVLITTGRSEVLHYEAFDDENYTCRG